MEKKITNCGPLMESTSKHSIYPLGPLVPGNVVRGWVQRGRHRRHNCSCRAQAMVVRCTNNGLVEESQGASQQGAVSREAGARPALPRHCERNELCQDHGGVSPWEGAERRGVPRARIPAWIAPGEPCEGKRASGVAVMLALTPSAVGGSVSWLVSLSCSSPPSHRLLRWPPGLRASLPQRRACRSRAWACRRLAPSWQRGTSPWPRTCCAKRPVLCRVYCYRCSRWGGAAWVALAPRGH